MNESKNILVVDDNKENLFLLIELLSDEGYTPFPANSGELALASLENNTPDLILLDIRMPGMDGFEVCKRIKQNEKNAEIPIIFLTAEIDIDEKLKGFRIGAVDYVTKPFHEEELIARINTHLKLYHYNQLFRKQTAEKLIKNEAKLKIQNAELEQKVKERTNKLKIQNEILKKAKEKAEISENNLHERVKELEGIFSLGLLSDKYERLDDIFNEFVNKIVPNSMQFTGKVFVFLQINKQEYTNIKNFTLTENFKTISSEIKVFNKDEGRLTVAYIEDLHFIKIYEQKLIKAYAEKISNIIESKLTEQKILKVMINAEDKERAKLAKELHDGLGPLLATTKLYSKALINTKSKKETNFIISKINETIEESLQCSQEISNNLSPHILHNFGLTTAIESFASKLSAIKDIDFNFQSNLKIRIDENVETTLYRVTVELIHNSIKHAKAKNISIKIILADNKINYVYSDDGIGFNIKSILKENKGMGLTNIYSRIKSLNGTLNIDSKKENGLQVAIVVNLN